MGAHLLLGEPLGPAAIGGSALILLALILNQLGQREASA